MGRPPAVVSLRHLLITILRKTLTSDSRTENSISRHVNLGGGCLRKPSFKISAFATRDVFRPIARAKKNLYIEYCIFRM